MKRLVLTHSLSTGGMIRRLFRKIEPNQSTRVIASYDDYSHGPLKGAPTSRDFLQERRAFWKSWKLNAIEELPEVDLELEHQVLVNHVKSATQVELWIADTVQDVFYAAVTLHLLAKDGVDTSDASVRFFDSEPVGPLESLEAAYRGSRPERLDPGLYDDLWRVLSQGSGSVLKSFLDKRDLPNPIFAALTSYLLRFPEFNAGLGSIDRALLGAGSEVTRRAVYTVGYAMALGLGRKDRIGDGILFRRLLDLCSMKPSPWFHLEEGPRSMRDCLLHLTESGRRAREQYSVPVLE